MEYENRHSAKELLPFDIKFDFAKPSKLIEYLIEISTPDKDAIILDSFAGSGTTAHAVLNKNHKDGGNRKFILIEMLDYADTLTSERVKRVINGYDRNNDCNIGFNHFNIRYCYFVFNKNYFETEKADF